ncbi:adenine-specific methyltransferase EcoRI family protein [Bifidobacterium breve]|uniref:adenine-specific methyltransferase EcoRI family protein n=1 Tax=Bifidobacterium breve TaxID=1685 RepID=UPI0012D84676
MRSTADLVKAQKNKADSFYTTEDMVEKELSHYTDSLSGKTILCNCNDGDWSAFVAWFLANSETTAGETNQRQPHNGRRTLGRTRETVHMGRSRSATQDQGTRRGRRLPVSRMREPAAGSRCCMLQPAVLPFPGLR